MDKPIVRTRHRLHFLDVIRGIAALSVVLQHFGAWGWGHFDYETHVIFNPGKFGVTLFFLASGFVIPLTLEADNSLKRFWTSRFFRLYPLYWFSLILALIVILFKVNRGSPGFADHLVRNWLVNLTMIQAVFRVPNCMELTYTLAIEMGLYVAMSILFVLGLHRKTTMLTWLGAFVFCLSTVIVPLTTGIRVPYAGLWLILCFMLGTALYRVYKGEMPVSVASWLVGTSLAVSAAGCYVNYVYFSKLAEPYSFTAAFLPGFLGGAVFVLMYGQRAAIWPSVFVYLGTTSYSIYLIHSVCWDLSERIVSPAVHFAVALPLTLLISTATYYGIEEPFIRYGKMAIKLRPNTGGVSKDAVSIPGNGSIRSS